MNIQIGYQQYEGRVNLIACVMCGAISNVRAEVMHRSDCIIGKLSPVLKPMDQVAVLMINPLDPEKKLTAVDQGHIQAIDGDQVTVVVQHNVPFGILQLAEAIRRCMLLNLISIMRRTSLSQSISLRCAFWHMMMISAIRCPSEER